MAKDKEKILDQALERFKRAQDAESELREDALDDIEFANNEQWDKKTLEERKGRPSLTVNKIAGVLKQIRGDQRQNKPSIKVRPVDSAADPEVAKILNGLIKNIEYQSGADSAYDTAFDQAIEGGWGYFRIDNDYADEGSFEQDLYIRRIVNPFSVYVDPSYTEADASDIQWAFITDWMEKEDFEEKYPKIDRSKWPTGRGEGRGDWWTKESVRIAEYFWKEPTETTIYQLGGSDDVTNDMLIARNGQDIKEFGGKEYLISYDTDEAGERVPLEYQEIVKKRTVKTHKVMWCKMTEHEILEGPVEKAGKYIPIVLVMGEECYIEGKRYLRSAHRFARDAQKVYNWMVSTSVETVAMAPKQPWLLSTDQIAGHEKQWDVAHRRPMPYLLYNAQPNQDKPNRQMGSIPDSGALQERMGAADDIKATTGIYDASLGARGNETSGVAIRARELQGDISTFTFVDNLMRAIRHAGRILVDLIPYFYSGERTVRILGPDGTEQFVEINKSVIDMQTGATQTINDITQGRYDVVVDTGPAYPTQRAEAAKNMLDFAKAMPQTGGMLLDLIAKNMDWPGADEIYERLQMMQGQQQQPSMEDQIKMQELQLKAREQDRKDFEAQIDAVKKIAEAQAEERKQDLEEIKAALQGMGAQFRQSPHGATQSPGGA